MEEAFTHTPKYENPLFEKHTKGLPSKKRQWVLIIIISIPIIFWVISLVSMRNPSSFIYLATYSGNKRHSDAELTGILNTTLSGSYLGMYPKKNIYVASTKNIAQALQNKFFYEQVTVEKVYSKKTLFISVKEQPLEYIVKYNDTVRYMSQDGTLLEDIKQEEVQNHTYLTVMLPQTFIQKEEESEKEYINQDVVTKITELRDTYTSIFSIPITSIEYESETAQDVKIHNQDAWYIYVDSSRDITEQIQSAFDVYTQNIKNTNKDEVLSYIDVRVPARAYYK